MSDSVSMKRRLVSHLQDMLNTCRKIRGFVDDLDRSAFASDIRTYDATLFNIALLGETATRIPKEFRDEHSEILWRDIIGVRNRIIHVYPGVDADVVWSIIEDDIPRLMLQVQALLEELADRSEAAER